jgi:hypothetical protein
VQIDSLALRMRPRRPLEAADVGSRLCQHAAGDVYRCYGAVAVPVIALALASGEIAAWLPTLVLWWVKPWLDRTVLFVLARAAFGQSTTLGDLWRAQRQVWWGQLLLTLTWRRLSPWRSFTQPVYQLEGLTVWQLRKRLRQIRGRQSGSAALLTSAFSLAETTLALALAALLFLLTPSEQSFDLAAALNGEAATLVALVLPLAYAGAVLFLEPFYVANGFAMYLNRRAELEAWDVEQELRRAFAG